MKTGTWKNVLLFLSKVSGLDINEELRKENEYLKAEIEIYRKQLERLGRNPKFTDGMRRCLVEKALALGGRMRDVVTIVRPDTGGEMTKHSFPTVFAAQRDGFIAQTQRGYHALLSLFVLACGTLTVGRLLCLFLAPQVAAAHGRGAL